MQKNILIIGAGIAGLAAANYLVHQGCKVQVLEARNRIGGRIWTDYTLGAPFSLGATWLHGLEGNPLTDLIKKYNIKSLPSDQFLVLDSHKELIPNENVQAYRESYHSMLIQAEKYARDQTQDISLEVALKKASLILQSDQEQDLLNWATHFTCFYNGAGIEELSAQSWDEEEVFAGGNYMLLDGYDPVIQGLAQGCDIQLNTVVQQINYDESSLQVITKHGSHYADAIIITVPLGVLKQGLIRFVPALPNIKQTAIDRLGMGTLNTVALKFTKRFWPETSFSLFVPSCQFKIATYTCHHFLQQPILAAWSAGKNARELENLPDLQIIEQAMDGLRYFFGNDLPSLENYLITRWSQDPFSLGSYSYIAVGSSGADYDQLAEPIDNKLFFAGEATCRQYLASTHGAYLSGIREAKRIMNL